MRIIALILLLISILIAKESGKDHPLISRFADARMTYYQAKDFDAFLLLRCEAKGVQKDLKKCESFEVSGKLTKIKYSVPSKYSGFEVYSNYLDALSRAGYMILANIRTKKVRDFVAHKERFVNGYPDPYNLSEDDDQHYYIAAVTPKKDAYVAIYVADGYKGRNGAVFVGVVEPKELRLGRVSAKTIADKLQAQGHIALYGIYFDFDKATIKPASKPTLDAIAKFLRKHPDIKLYIVGHTDNRGSLSYNMQLSRKRAKAVLDRLIKEYKINPRRLKAFGVGPLCPVASNHTESGRAKNRRVELVEQ